MALNRSSKHSKYTKICCKFVSQIGCKIPIASLRSLWILGPAYVWKFFFISTAMQQPQVHVCESWVLPTCGKLLFFISTAMQQLQVHVSNGKSVNEALKPAIIINSLFIEKMGQPRPLFCLFSVFSIKQYNFYNRSIWKNVQVTIQYTAPGFEPTTLLTWIVTHNH